jgi:hypothetical protein
MKGAGAKPRKGYVPGPLRSISLQGQRAEKPRGPDRFQSGGETLEIG